MAKKENNKDELVVVKGKGVVERLENILEGYVKIESQGMFCDGRERGLQKVIIFIKRDECEILFN